MASIFITGVAGFLGSYLADALIRDGHRVAGCDNLIGGYIENVPKEVVFSESDCRDMDSMTELLNRIDIVYHCAATAYEGLSVFSPKLIHEHVATATVSMIVAAIRNGVGRFVYCSSMARYGAQDEVPFREDMVPHPQDPYGIAKYVGEQYLVNLCEIHGMEYVIAVPHNIIGPRQKYDDPYRNVASIMINMMLQGKRPIIYGDGLQKRCFSFIEDDVVILKELALSPTAKNEIFNIGPDQEFITINALAAKIAHLLGSNCEPLYVPDRPQEVKYANCSAEKIRKYFDYKSKYSLEDGLLQMIEWISARGAQPFTYHLDLEIVNDKCPKTWKDRLL